MKDVITTEKLPIKLWLTDIEEGALEQAKNIANLPFVQNQVAIMPDSHQGYGAPIGSVFCTKSEIVPNAVGVDIGCGMLAAKLSIKAVSPENVKKIIGKTREYVPVGKNHHKEDQPCDWEQPDKDFAPIVHNEYKSSLRQIGTLGGGNHFIELQKDSENHLWVMIHSGSRNLGYKVANRYHLLAKHLNKMWYSNIPEDLAFLPMDEEPGKLYWNEMNLCIKFAELNRNLMMKRVLLAIKEVYSRSVRIEEQINKPHNFADRENHFNQNYIVHRKGATRARRGELGMIPGSQGSFSYIVIGKGESNSFTSCSHGAGRVMSRNKARKKLDLQAEKSRLEQKGIVHSIRSEKDLDEAPSSYKDIEKVMDNQKDLIEIKHKLEPLGVLKG